MICLDFETYSTLDIRKVGTYKYTESCEVLLMAYAIGDGPVKVWDATCQPAPIDFLSSLHDPEVELVAHNAQFDMNVLRHALSINTNLNQWNCSMVRAMAHSLPGALGDLGNAIGLSSDMKKIADGKKLIQRFCKPAPSNHKADKYDRHSHPEEWARFVEYARMDVEAMRHIWKLLPNWNYIGSELDLWRLDQKINARGFKVDLDLAHAAIRATDRCQGKLAAEIDELTGGKVQKATQRDKLLAHIADEYGFQMEGLTKADVETALNNPDLMDPVKRLLQIRAAASRSSSAKYQKLLDVVTKDGRVKGGLQFNGASRTRRWSGRMFQPQNLPRPDKEMKKQIDLGIEAMKTDCADLIFDNVMSLSSATIRGAVVADKKKKLVISDLSNIEGRVNAWISGEKWKIKAFEDFDRGEGPDLYNLAYSKSFHKPVEDITDDERQIGKTQELQLGYQGGVGAFVTMAEKQGLDLDQLSSKVLSVAPSWAVKESNRAYAFAVKMKNTYDLPKKVFIGCDVLKRLWRKSNSRIEKTWGELEKAAILAIKNPDTNFEVGILTFRRLKQWLLLRLPSGQVLCYYQPQVSESGKVSYMGNDSKAKKSNKWKRRYTYGGHLAENVCQSISRDIMAHGMQPAEDAGYEIILTVHDELITETPDTDEYSVKGLSDILATNPPWADGLPLAADGFETFRYRKD